MRRYASQDQIREGPGADVENAVEWIVRVRHNEIREKKDNGDHAETRRAYDPGVEWIREDEQQ
jgi:hypothetical protein